MEARLTLAGPETNELLYQVLLTGKETKRASNTEPWSGAVVALAAMPFAPYKPEMSLNLILTSLLGLQGSYLPAFCWGGLCQCPVLLGPRAEDNRKSMLFNVGGGS